MTNDETLDPTPFDDDDVETALTQKVMDFLDTVANDDTPNELATILKDVYAALLTAIDVLREIKADLTEAKAAMQTFQSSPVARFMNIGKRP